MLMIRTKTLLIYLFSFLLLLLSGTGIYANSIVIVKDHQPKATIVLPNSASQTIQQAAKVLQDYIKRSTGAVLPIITHNGSNAISIHIGLTSFVKAQKINLHNLDEDGFILQGINAKNFIIIGGSDWGTEFGIYAFLERYIGVLWLMPTEMGVDIPKHATVILPDSKVIDTPLYLSRQVSPININATDDLGVWGRFNGLKGRINFHHNLLNLFDTKEYAKTNPDFYSFTYEKREIPLTEEWQPNFSAPGIADSASAKIIRYFKQNPKISSYSLGINDYGLFDQTQRSKVRRNGKKNYLGLEDVSDDYFKWANEVAKKVTARYPNKNFGLLAYNNVASPPSKNIGVNPNIIPFLTYERLRWSDNAQKMRGQQLTKEWLTYCPSIGWYDYVYGLNYLTPRVWFHEMQDYLIWGTKHKIKYYYAELYPNWGEGPKPWILSKLLWNPNQDIETLLNLWYARFAGNKAAPKLKEFYAIWEKFWTKDINSSKWDTKDGQYLNFLDLAYLNAVPQEYIQHSDLLMEEAYRLADTEIHRQRVSKLREMWRLYKQAVQTYKANDLPVDKKQVILLSSPEFNALLNNLGSDPVHSESIKNIKLYFNIK